MTDDGWIEYSSDLKQLGIEAESEVISGLRGSSGECTFAGENAGTGETSAVLVREEVAFNPATCETEFLVAELSQSEAAEYLTDSPAESADDSTGISEGAVAKSPTRVAAAAATHSRWVRTAWVDPIEIDISSQKTALQWNSSAWLKRQVGRDSFKGCIGGKCLDETYIVSKNAFFGSYSNRFEYSGVTHFRNTAFANWVVFFLGAGGWAACGFPTSSTANFHHDGQVVGFKNGDWKVNWDDRKNGACTNLVHHESSNGGAWPF
ncbi:MAG TPA: hypothetical protein VFM50_10430 [Nocardioidaceae bacterium]|nr:hypothetical protein [Nocardioidaceae bacterium]